MTVLQRSSSGSVLPSGVNIITIADDYPLDALVRAFKGQDVVANAIATTKITEQFRFVDAAIAAGVKRYVPSEYGLDNLNPAAQALSSVFKEKGEVQAYLREKESTGLEWMAIACGVWVAWSMQANFLGLRVKERKIVFWDDGEGVFSCSTLENTALALVRALLKPEETKNRLVCVSDFPVTQAELLEAMKRASPGEKWTIEKRNSEKAIKEAKQQYAQGDLMAMYTLIEIGLVTGKYSGHLEKHASGLQNKLLGLQPHDLDEVVRSGLKKMGVPVTDA